MAVQEHRTSDQSARSIQEENESLEPKIAAPHKSAAGIIRGFADEIQAEVDAYEELLLKGSLEAAPDADLEDGSRVKKARELRYMVVHLIDGSPVTVRTFQVLEEIIGRRTNELEDLERQLAGKFWDDDRHEKKMHALEDLPVDMQRATESKLSQSAKTALKVALEEAREKTTNRGTTQSNHSKLAAEIRRITAVRTALAKSHSLTSK